MHYRVHKLYDLLFSIIFILPFIFKLALDYFKVDYPLLLEVVSLFSSSHAFLNL